jgi:hypothetical protein
MRPAPSAKRGATVIADDGRPAVLDRIAETDVTLAVWRRPSSGGRDALAAWLDALPADNLPEGRFVAPVAEVPAKLALLCDLVEIEDCDERALLIADIAGLADRFARLAGNNMLDLKLEAVDHDSCWRFHRDHVGLRLNSTYRGPGTQIVPASQASRALRSQRRYLGPLGELARFDVALFKGVTRAGSYAIVHRSPPIEGKGLTRLFLCLNEPVLED